MSPPLNPAHAGTQGRVEVLDLLRLFAVLAVLLFHYGFRGAAADGFTAVSLPDLTSIAKYGYLGVQLFFIISGFVIAYSAEGRTATGFAIARIARIYPGFVFCMTATFIATIAIGAPRFEATALQWFANLFIVAPGLKQPFMDGAYWSIVYEITFYAWVCALIAAGLFWRELGFIVVIWLAISIFNESLLGSVPLRRLLITDQSAFFAAGLLLYEIYRGRWDRSVLLLLALATITAVNEALAGAAWLRGHYHIALDNGVIAGLCLAAIALVWLSTRVRRLPLPPGLILAVGGLTYPMYLLHQHIGYMLLNRFEGTATAAQLIVATTLAVTAASWLIWRYVERPAQKWMKRSLNSCVEQLGGWVALIRARRIRSTAK
jgi:peptidoglycan/LPS O-acetylase OafA/YrhL